MRGVVFFLILLSVFSLGLDIPKELGKVQSCPYRVVFLHSDIVAIRYPVFLMEDSQRLNEEVERLVDAMFSCWKNSLVDNVKAGLRDLTFFSLDFEIRRCDNKIISLTIIDSAYTGGAHPLPSMKAVNFDRRSGKVLHLKDLFLPGVDYVSEISKFVEESFKKNKVFLLEKFERIKEDQDFYIDNSGIVVFFQPYEYTSFAYGFPRVHINFDDLEGLRKDLKGELFSDFPRPWTENRVW